MRKTPVFLVALAALMFLVPSVCAAQKNGMVRIDVYLGPLYLRVSRGAEVLMDSVPITASREQGFCFEGRCHSFPNPAGVRTVLKKEKDPYWNRPGWAYDEVGLGRGLHVISLAPGQKYRLRDGSVVEYQDSLIGRRNLNGDWIRTDIGMEVIYDDKVFMPPLSFPQRNIPDVLGPFGLYLGDGFWIHGMNDGNSDKIQMRDSHGCIRVPNEYLAKVYELVPVGAKVYFH